MMGESQECMEDQPSIGGKDPEPETSKNPKLCLRFTNRASKNTKGKKYQGSLWLNQNRLIPLSNPHLCWFEHHLSSFNYLSCGASSCIATKKRNETYFQDGTSMMRFPVYFQRNFSASFLGCYGNLRIPLTLTVSSRGAGGNGKSQPFGWSFSGFSWLLMLMVFT